MNENIIFARNTIIFIAVTIALAWASSQTLKTFLKFAITGGKDKTKKNIVKQFFSDGGFPSSHTTVVVTAVIIISPILYEAAYYATSKTELLCCIALEVISLLWAALIIRDALGIRMAVENNAQITHTALTDIPELISSLLPKKIQEKWVKPLPNSIKDKWANLASELNIDTGHRPHEVFGGCLLAIILGTGANAIKTSNWSWLIIDIIIAILYVAFSYLILAKVYKNNSENKGKEK
jgi:acid phosphatase family membrane protein YuiD